VKTVEMQLFFLFFESEAIEMRKQVALTVALALAAAPQGDAFFQPNAGLVRGPALRGGAVGVCPTASRSVRNRTPPLHMSDLSDMAIEILKRAEKQLDTLDDISLARVSVPPFATRHLLCNLIS
jgi:hypothetical protein